MLQAEEDSSAAVPMVRSSSSAAAAAAAAVVSKQDGEDFLFLFDLLAHTCGLESTLRVLTHSDETFYELCRPKFDPGDSLELEEDKLKVSWRPADIERWLHTGSVRSRYRGGGEEKIKF